MTVTVTVKISKLFDKKFLDRADFLKNSQRPGRQQTRPVPGNVGSGLVAAGPGPGLSAGCAEATP